MSHLHVVSEDGEPDSPRTVKASFVEVTDTMVVAFGGQSNIDLDDLRVLMESARVLARFEFACPTCGARPFERCHDTRIVHDDRVVGEEPHRWLSYEGRPVAV